MPQKLLAAIAPGTRLRIMNELKRTQGVTVKELAERLEMSYMGVKGACIDLVNRGLLESWREPRPATHVGRPRIVYRLTSRSHQLFPVASNPLTRELLDAASQLFGPDAATQLLHKIWEKKVETLRDRLNGETLKERAECLAKLRESEGHMASVDNGGGAITEHHCPYLDVMREYPVIAQLETQMFSALLGKPVDRTEDSTAGLYKVTFSFADAQN